jgi:hypothetical protein
LPGNVLSRYALVRLPVFLEESPAGPGVSVRMAVMYVSWARRPLIGVLLTPVLSQLVARPGARLEV